jgi:LysR family carnitine catabolism transcriptional activator
MINLPLRPIRTLICLAETGSFRGAAARLGISQPAVSAHIRALEDQYGVPLVHRTTRQVALTPAGKAFAARAVRAFADLDLATRDLHDLSAAQHGQVTVACIPPLMSLMMPRVIEALATDRPAIEVRLRDVTSNELDGLVARGEAELGIGPPGAGSSLAFKRLRRDDFVAVVPRQHPLAGRREIELAELIAYPSSSIRAKQTRARSWTGRCSGCTAR